MSQVTFFSRLRAFLKKTAVALALRIAISVVLLLYLMRLSALNEIFSAFRRIDFLSLLAFFALYFFSVVVQAFRWKTLLRVWDLSIKASALFCWIMTGLFLSNFLPGSLGGDAFRIYSGARDVGKLEDVAATIFYERVFGYASLLTLGLIALSLRFNFAEDWLFWLTLGGAFLGVIALTVFASMPIFGRWSDLLVERYAFLRKARLNEWLKSFRFKIHRPRLLLGAFALSLLIQFVDLASFHVIAAALRLPISFVDLLLFVPILYLAILLPFSFNGIGIRESVFVIFSKIWGIQTGDAVAFSLTVFTLGLAGSLLGGIIYWFDKPAAKNLEQTS